MEKNKINGVKPFNEFLFKSCYYHQLIAGISCFGVDRDAILLNAFILIQKNFNTVKEVFLNEKKLEKLLGYKRTHCNITKEKLIRCIDKGNPIIVGVDCYYLESRKDTYQNQHFPHFVLAYGYDLGKKEVNVVDHQYLNSYEYQEKIISLDNLLLANRMLIKGVLKRKRSCYILKKKKNACSYDIWKYINEEKISNNYKNSLENLNELRRIMSHDLEAARENVGNITSYLNDIKIFYYTLSKTKFFIDNQQKQEAIMSLISAYSNVLSLFWKVKAQNNYEYITKHLESAMRKLEEIEKYEKIVYDFLVEVSKKK